MAIIPTINLPIEVEVKEIPTKVEAKVLLQINFPQISFHQIKHQAQDQRDISIKFVL